MYRPNTHHLLTLLSCLLLVGLSACGGSEEPRSNARAERLRDATPELPTAVARAISDRYPTAQVDDLEYESIANVYEVEVELADGSEYELKITPEGLITDIRSDYP